MPRSKTNLFLHPKLIIFPLAQRGVFNGLPDELYLKILYRARFSRRLNMLHPQTYNEKLQYLKIHDRNPKYTTIVDKYEVRSIVQATIGKKYVVPILGLYDTVSSIEWGKLPEQFVIKCTHGTHCSIVCYNKADLDITDIQHKLSKWLRHNYYKDAREWPYKNVKPRIMIEQMLIPSESQELLDFKIMCFDGKAKYIVVHRNITSKSEAHTLNLFTTQWEPIDIEWDCLRYTGNIERPDNLHEIISLAERLAKGYSHIRVDFLICNNEIYFGELTLYPGAGFKPFSSYNFDYNMGQLIDLENTYDRNEYK